MVDCGIPGHITGLYVFAVVNLCALLNLSLVSADVFVLRQDDNGTVVASMEDKQAGFGPDFPENGIIGRLVYVHPHDACKTVDPPPPEMDLPWIALISRGPCHFDQKVFHAQKASYAAAIVHNSQGDDSVVQMAGGEYADKVSIPSVFVGYTDGMELARRYNYTDRSVVIRIEEYSGDDFRSYFWPFTIVLAICFLFVIVASLYKCFRYFQHRRRTRLSQRALKRIPTRKYKKGDHYDTCAICLDDYEEGEKLRVLPCAHTYHCKCIDPWLTKRKKTCPQCKRRVIPGQDTDSESEDEGEGAGENTPLLGNNNSPLAASRVPSYDGRPGQASTSSGRRGRQSAVVVVVNEGETAPLEAEKDGDDDNDVEDSDEELQGAVGGVGISDQRDFVEDKTVKTDVVVEVEPAQRHRSPSQNATAAAAAAEEVEIAEEADSDCEEVGGATPDPLTPLTSREGSGSPARPEGSINVAFSSSDDDGSPPKKGRKKKKSKSNCVV